MSGICDTLKPCPICGSEPEFQHFNITPNVRGRIICSCGIEIMQGANDTEDDLRIIWNTRDGLRQSHEWAELQSQLAEAERRAAMFERIAEDQKARNRDMRSTVNAVTGADADSRWHELFGTPERAARTLHHNGTLVCRECLIREECAKTPEDSDCMIMRYDALLEWLRSEDEVINEPDTIRNELTDSGLVNEQIRDAEMQITVLKEQLRVANEAHCATCVDCGTPLSGELRCTKCAAMLRGDA